MFVKQEFLIQPFLSQIKHLNRLEQIIARSEWQSKNIAESIMLDLNGNVIEGNNE